MLTLDKEILNCWREIPPKNDKIDVAFIVPSQKKIDLQTSIDIIHL